MASAYGETPLGLASHMLNVGGVLTRKAALKVPRYQRPYTWNERDVRQLIQDLWRAYKRGASYYFIGQIVLVKAARGKFEISDGQQRLATATMLIAYARDRLHHRAKHYQGLIMENDNPRLTLREEDANFFRGYVQEPGRMAAMAALAETSSDSKDLLCAAARTIETELRDHDDRELDAFMSYVARCCTLNVVDADERGGAATVFNTLNDRGTPLSMADIIKSDLLEQSGLSEADADSGARKWEEIEDMVSRRYFERLLYMRPFLLTGEPLLAAGDLASFRGAVERSGGVRVFLFDRLPRYARALRAIFHGNVDVGSASTDVNRRLKLMKQVDKWDWAPAALAFLAEHSGQPERARRFFQALDRFTFACELSVIGTRSSDGRYARAAKFAGDDKQLYGPRGALELTDAEHLRLIARLNHSSKRDGMRRLLMMRIEAAMQGGSVLAITSDVSVEHVLPNKGGAWWSDRFPDPHRRNAAAFSIGNYVLITHDQNERAGNAPYPEKRKVYFNTPNVILHAVTKDIAGLEEWTLDAIEARQERLARILCVDWDLVRGAGS